MSQHKFLADLYESTGSFYCHPGVGIGVGVTLKDFQQSFFAMGSLLSVEFYCMQTSLLVE